MSGALRALLIAGLLAATTTANAATDSPPGYSAAALYNAANAYARAGRPGLAVLNYERAALLAPQDPDIEANLWAVRESARLPAETPDRVARLVEVAGPTTLAFTGLAGVLMAGGSALVFRIRAIRGRRRVLPVAVGLAGIALVALTVCNAVMMWPRLGMGVVIVDAAPVRVAPVPLGEKLFALREAETVKLGAAHEGFFLVRTSSGQTGWVAQGDVAPVVPDDGG